MLGGSSLFSVFRAFGVFSGYRRLHSRTTEYTEVTERHGKRVTNAGLDFSKELLRPLQRRCVVQNVSRTIAVSEEHTAPVHFHVVRG